ncbi:MAG TPA: class I SAM-dependent methyltransferase [Chitinophagaceae bacterium]
MNSKDHWEKVYNSKPFKEVSWYQATPKVSLDFVRDLQIAKDTAIIDVGGGDSFFVDHLLDAGFTDVTVLDISEAAINRVKQRFGPRAGLVNWIVSDITEFAPGRKYGFWHDRAVFHFLTTKEQINKYLAVANKSLPAFGKIVIGTFSETGPKTCSGLNIKQYSESTLTVLIKKWFDKIKCIHAEHITPFNTIQNFLFCSFKKANA